MNNPIRGTVYSVLLATLRPIASILLKFGITYHDFERVCKAAFVGVAMDEYGSRGRSANVSRISLMTGLPRKVVRLVQAQLLEAPFSKNEVRSLPSEVLNLWHTDFRFCSTYGKPRSLTWDSGNDSFCELVRQCSRSVSPATMRAELARVGAVSESENGLFVANRRSFIPATTEERLIQGLQYGIRQLGMTVAYNAGTADGSQLRFQRIVWNYCLPKAQRGNLDRLLAERLREFSQEIDDLLSEADRETPSEAKEVIGVGLYQFVDDPANFRS